MMILKQALIVIGTCFLLISCGGNGSNLELNEQVSFVESADTRVSDPTSRPINNDNDELDHQIRAYIDRMFFLQISDAQRSANIRDAAAYNGISPERISSATGYSLDTVKWYLSLSDGITATRLTRAQEDSISTKLNALYLYDVERGSSVRVTGSWLSRVKTIYLNNVPQVITHRGNSSIDFLIGQSDCGRFEALMHDMSRVDFGFLGITSKCSGSISGIGVYQNFAVNDELINGKSLAVQAVIQANAWPIDVLVEVAIGEEVIYSAPMIPPTLSQISRNPLAPYNLLIPGEHVKPGIKIKVIGYSSGKGITFSSTILPTVSFDVMKATITFVPLALKNGKIGQVPSENVLRNSIIRRLPFPDDVTIRVVTSPYKLFSEMKENKDWSDGLATFTSIRRQILGSRGDYSTIFYGFVPWSGSSVIGIAYVGSYVALGIDISSNLSDGPWERTMTHELGHVLGRWHAPCGGAGNPDTEYPYPGGSLGTLSPFDLLTFNIVSINGITDVMGYCGGRWFSDYNYKHIASTIKTRYLIKPQALGIRTEREVVGFMIVVKPFEKLSLLTEGIENPGVMANELAIVDGEQRTAQILKLDHLPEIHVWIEGDKGKSISVTIDGNTYSGEI